MARKELKEVKLDENWLIPAALAAELGVARVTVSSWITRNKIDYVRLPGALTRGYLVDRRTAPAVQPVGRPTKKS
jgi:hypothetical protein